MEQCTVDDAEQYPLRSTYARPVAALLTVAAPSQQIGVDFQSSCSSTTAVTTKVSPFTRTTQSSGYV